MSVGIGHNKGPTMDAGYSWRRHSWTKARAALLPTLPIEVVRLRVRRAQELGLPYKTYASVRASSGHDVIGFLFSSNALNLLRAQDRLSVHRAARIGSLRDCDRLALTYPQIGADQVIPPCDAAARAPGPLLSWSDMRTEVAAILRGRGRPCGGYLVIGEMAAERDWAEAGRTAGFLTGARYFDASP